MRARLFVIPDYATDLIAEMLVWVSPRVGAKSSVGAAESAVKARAQELSAFMASGIGSCFITKLSDGQFILTPCGPIVTHDSDQRSVRLRDWFSGLAAQNGIALSRQFCFFYVLVDVNWISGDEFHRAFDAKISEVCARSMSVRDGGAFDSYGGIGVDLAGSRIPIADALFGGLSTALLIADPPEIMDAFLSADCHRADFVKAVTATAMNFPLRVYDRFPPAAIDCQIDELHRYALVSRTADLAELGTIWHDMLDSDGGWTADTI